MEGENEMGIQGIIEKCEAITKSVQFLAVFSSITLLYDLFWALYFKGDSSFRFKYWMQVGIFFVCFIILTILVEYKRKMEHLSRSTDIHLLDCFDKKTKIKRFYNAGTIYSLIAVFLGLWSSIYNNTITFILFSILFLVPLIFMLSDTFRFIPADECLNYFNKKIKELDNYSIDPPSKKSEPEEEKYFLNRKDSSKFVIEQIPREKWYPPLKLVIFAATSVVLDYLVTNNGTNLYYAIGLIIFFIYISILLIQYRKSYYEIVDQFNDSLKINLIKTEISDKFIRRSAYIFFYGYFIYWVFSVSYFTKSYTGNYFEVLVSSFQSSDWITFVDFWLYFIVIVFAMSMVSDGFGIVPVICNLSKDISLQIKRRKIDIDLYHPDKSAGFRPLGNFCLKMSFLIALPFIIGMPIQLYRYDIRTDKVGIINYLIDDSFNVAFIGVGLAGATIFVFSVYYINKLIEERKKEKLQFLMDMYEGELKECKLNPPSSKITCIDSAIKKIENIVLPPYGKTNFIRFYSALLVPSISILIGLKII